MDARWFFLLTLPFAGCFDPAIGDEPLPNTVRGHALSLDGQPLADVDIVVDETVSYDANLTTTTDDEGHYELEVPDGSWRVWATHHPLYLGRTYELDLHPLDDDSFAGADGAVRDFEWRLEGEKPAPLSGTHGGTVYAYVDSSIARAEDLQLTFEPVGPLIDGSVGETVVRTPDAGGMIEDVPLGQYRIQVYDGRRSQRLKLRLQTDDKPHQFELVAVFEPVWDLELCENCLRLDLRGP